MIDFPLARYRLDFQVSTPIHLPAYAGSTLRGAFGGALRATACMTRQKTCPDCPLLRTCPYPAIFETPPPPEGHELQKFSQAPNPYAIEPPAWGEQVYQPGETLSFHLVLAGRALDQLPIILFAFNRALQRGIGKGDGTAELMTVSHLGGDAETLILDGAGSALREHDTTLPMPESGDAASVRLRIHTPLRLQENSRPLGPENLTPRTLLIGLVRRVALISEFHAGKRLALDFHALGEQASAVTDEKHLHWRDWTRYSSRQQQKMSLGGVVGTWTLHGNLNPFLPFLYLGQWLHVGKNASFGLGQYEMDDPSPQPSPAKGEGDPEMPVDGLAPFSPCGRRAGDDG